MELGDVVSSSFYGPRFSKNDYTVDNSGVPTIRTTDMKNGKIVISEETPRVNVPKEKVDLLKVEPGDLLITRTRSIGVMALFEGGYVAIPSAYLIRFRFITSQVLPEYVHIALTSPEGQNQMGLGVTAITQPNINAKTIRAIKINIPSVYEQKEIVQQVEKIFAFANKIEQQTHNALNRVNNLTQSILAKAFRGDLTAEWREKNPDLITGENSAEALLAKIKEEREKLKPAKKTRKKS